MSIKKSTISPGIAGTFTEIAPRSAGHAIIAWIAAGHGRPHGRIRGMGEVH